MGFFDWLTGKGSKKPLYALDEKPPVEETPPPQNIPPQQEIPPQEETPLQKLAHEIIPPRSRQTKTVTVDGRVITDPAEIARAEAEFASMLDPFKKGGMFGNFPADGQKHTIVENISYTSETGTPTPEMLERIKSLAASGSREVKMSTRKAWRDGKEVTDADEIEKIITETLKKSED